MILLLRQTSPNNVHTIFIQLKAHRKDINSVKHYCLTYKMIISNKSLQLLQNNNTIIEMNNIEKLKIIFPKLSTCKKRATCITPQK